MEEFLKEALALWGQRAKIRLLRADSGSFDDKLLNFLEQRLLPYIVVAKLTPWVKRAAQRVEQWATLDDDYAVGEFRLKLLGWSVERRFVVIREQVREGRDSVGRKLIDCRATPSASLSPVAPILRKGSGGTTTVAPTWRIAWPS